MPLSKRDHHIQVVLETINHLWHHQISRLVILQKICGETQGVENTTLRKN